MYELFSKKIIIFKSNCNNIYGYLPDKSLLFVDKKSALVYFILIQASLLCIFVRF